LIKQVFYSYHFCIWVSVNEVERCGVKAPSDKLCDVLLVEIIGGVKEVTPDNIQGTCPDCSTPVIENVSSLEILTLSPS
jgi:hypothetical protein